MEYPALIKTANPVLNTFPQISVLHYTFYILYRISFSSDIGSTKMIRNR